MPTVTVNPGGLVFHVEAGLPFRDVLLQEGLLVDFPCGGRGVCNQCRITIDPPTDSGKAGKKSLPASEIKKGVRLACQAVVEGDCTISIAEEKELDVTWRNESESTHLLFGDPRIVRHPFAPSPPQLEDQRADWERIQDTMKDDGFAPTAEVMPSAQLEAFARCLRQNKWSVDAIIDDQEILACVQPQTRIYGFAVDLGTTTVDMALHDMETGRRVARKTLLNHQAAYGADVISRAHNFQQQRKEVRQAALETIAEGAQMLLTEQDVSPDQVVHSVVVGNSVMIHILLDMNPHQLTLSPYITMVSGTVRRLPDAFGWTFQKWGYVETLPLISAYVGADTMGMILALDLGHTQDTSLSIDIGTNGEMVLAHEGQLITTSTAAGPAFEGAQIACGMRALPGAVTWVDIPSGKLDLKIVGDGPAKGFCGSGLISAVASLLDTGIIDATGRMLTADEVDQEDLKPYLMRVDDRPAFAIVPDHSVYITQKDVRELQLAKGAVRTGIDMLLAESGIELDQVKKIRLAGNFGAGVDIGKAMRLGLIPEVPVERVDAVGNAALRGASLALVAKGYRQRADELHRNCRFLELAGKPDFQKRFTDSMMF